MQEMQEGQVQSLGWEDPLEKGMQPTPVFIPWKSYGQRSLAGYSPWGRKESDTTEVTLHAHSILVFVQFSRSVVSDSLRPRGLQHARPPYPSPTPRVHPNPCPSSQWCHWTLSSSVVPFSSCLQSFPASGSFPMSQLFTSGGQSIGVSAQHQSFQWTPRTDLL